MAEDFTYEGVKKWKPTNDEWVDFYTSQKLPFQMLENEYLVVEPDDGSTQYYCYEHNKLRQFRGGSIKTVKEQTPAEIFIEDLDSRSNGTKGAKKQKKSSKGNQTIIYPRNAEQVCAFDMIKDSTKPIKLITGRWGSGKAQPNSTLIPTPNGTIAIGDLKPGDFVFDKLGHKTKVINVFPQGKLDVYRITLADGRTTLCGPEHLWVVKSHSGGKRTVRTITTEEMFRTGIGNYRYSKKYGKEYIDYRWHLPMNSAVEYEQQDKLPVDPYVVGCFLGDGCCTTPSLVLSSNDEFIPNEIARLIGAKCAERACDKNYNWKFELPDDLKTTKKKNFQTAELFEEIPELITTSNLKRIPKKYLAASIDDRFSLLQGLLDTDGAVTKEKAKVSFGSKNKSLCEDIIVLCRSLGLRCHLNTYYRGIKNSYEYSVTITGTPEEKLRMFRLPRKLNRIIDSNEHKKAIGSLNKTWNNFITVTNIEKLGYQEDMTCLYVDNDEHLYLTNDFIVTHNTMILVTAALEALQLGKFDKIVWLRNNIDVKDTKDLGALPGEVIDKLLPFLGPFIDHAGENSVRTMIQKGTLCVEPLQTIRGRNFKNTLIMCSEAENLTKEHIQLIIARAAEGSEVWLDGDNRQRDRAAFEKSRGLETLIERLQGKELFGYVHLIKSERSKVAEMADLLD